MPQTSNIVFYDGNCGFCDTTVRWIMRIDSAKKIRYAPLQGETAKALLPPELRTEENLKTLVYLDPQERLFTKSTAVIEILATVGGFWKTAAAAKILPESLRDSLYDSIARRRRKLIAKESCPLPTEEQKSRNLP